MRQSKGDVYDDARVVRTHKALVQFETMMMARHELWNVVLTCSPTKGCIAPRSVYAPSGRKRNENIVDIVSHGTANSAKYTPYCPFSSRENESDTNKVGFVGANYKEMSTTRTVALFVSIRRMTRETICGFARCSMKME